MSEKSILIKVLGDTPRIKIIDFFLDNKIFDFSKKEIIEETGMSKKTFYKYFPNILESGIVKKSRKVGKSEMFKLNRESPIVQKLIEFERGLSEKEIEDKKVPV